MFEAQRHIYDESLPPEGMSTPKISLVTLEATGIVFPLDRKKEYTIEEKVSEGENECSIVETTQETSRKEMRIYTYQRPEDESVQAYIRGIVEMMIIYDCFDEHQKAPLQDMRDKINKASERHLKKGYDEILKSIDFTTVVADDFGQTAEGLKRRLWKYRMDLHCGAILAVENAGYDVSSTLNKIAQIRIHPIKKEISEPVFDYIKKNYCPNA